jgi:hypothetical protein
VGFRQSNTVRTRKARERIVFLQRERIRVGHQIAIGKAKVHKGYVREQRYAEPFYRSLLSVFLKKPEL